MYRERVLLVRSEEKARGDVSVDSKGEGRESEKANRKLNEKKKDTEITSGFPVFPIAWSTHTKTESIQGVDWLCIKRR